MKYTKQEEQEAREEYDRLISSLSQDEEMMFKFKGHWEDKEIKNKFNRTIIEKGDKDKFIKFYLEDKKIIEDGMNLDIETILNNEKYEFE